MVDSIYLKSFHCKKICFIEYIFFAKVALIDYIL